MKYRGVVCENVVLKLRFKKCVERMGHIELASPVTHLFLKSLPSVSV